MTILLNRRNLEIVSDSAAKNTSLERLPGTIKPQPAEWAKDFITVPIYPPSFRQGFIRPTICVWNVCVPKTPKNAGSPKKC